MKKHDVRKSAYKFVGKVLRNQHGIERAVKEARMQTGGHSGGGGGHAFVSDPTAQQAVRLATELQTVTLDDGWTLRWPERWLRIVECAYDNCYPYEAKAMRYYYDAHTVMETGEQYGMDRSTVYRIRSEFLHFATELACQCGLVRVVSSKELKQA